VSPRIPIRLLAVQSDERLARLVRDGHERAFEALVHRYRRPLLRYCRRLGLADARAEDALQQALLNAWLALSAGAEVRKLRPWLYRVAHNAAVNAKRGAGERSVVLEEPVAASTSVGEAVLERRIAVCDALADVAALPAMQRRAILLTALEGKTHDEVAGLLGVKQGAVRALLYRARATLRNAAAFAPQPLLGLASAGSGSAGQASERLTEVSTGGALGLTGALLKGVAVAVTAGVIVGGASVVRVPSHRAHASAYGAAAPRAARSASSRHSHSIGAGASGASGAGTLAGLRTDHARGAARFTLPENARVGSGGVHDSRSAPERRPGESSAAAALQTAPATAGASERAWPGSRAGAQAGEADASRQEQPAASPENAQAQAAAPVPAASRAPDESGERRWSGNETSGDAPHLSGAAAQAAPREATGSSPEPAAPTGDSYAPAAGP
jgi:RNA polymerase sigma factor (sigma-70 family)